MKYIRGCEVKLLDVAQDFYEAYQRCWAPHDSYYVSIPAFSNGFFACELFIKHILANDNKKIIEHNLSLLFHNLPDNIQEAIKKEYSVEAQEFLSKYNISFDELLEKIATGFEFWRYVFEDKNRATEVFEKDFPFAYSEGFLQHFLPIISRIASDLNKDNK